MPGTSQESPLAPSQGAPPLQGPHCHHQEQKRQRLFWKVNLMLITPCLLPGGMVWALIALISALLWSSSWFSKSLHLLQHRLRLWGPRCWKGAVEGNSPAAWAQVGEPPTSYHAGLPVPAAAQPGVGVLANKVLGDPSGWKALYKWGCQPVIHQEAPL